MSLLKNLKDDRSLFCKSVVLGITWDAYTLGPGHIPHQPFLNLHGRESGIWRPHALAVSNIQPGWRTSVLEQSCSVSTPLHFQLGSFMSWGCPGCPTLSGSNPGLSSTRKKPEAAPPVWQEKCLQMLPTSPGAKSPPREPLSRGNMHTRKVNSIYSSVIFS